VISELIPKIAAWEASEEKRGRWRPRCSNSGTERCVRADVYSAAGESPAPLPGRAALIFSDGNWAEELVLDWIRKTAFRVHSEQMVVEPLLAPGTHHGYTCGQKGCGQKVGADVVHGHIDGIVTDPMGQDFLLEIKTANHFTWGRWASGADAPWDYITQASLYAIGIRKVSSNVDRVLIVIKNKNTSQFLEYVITVPKELDGVTVIESALFTEGEHPVPFTVAAPTRDRLIPAAVVRWQDVARLAAAKTLPPRPFVFGYWRCDYCPFSGTCWKGYEEEAGAAGDAEAKLLSPEVQAMVLTYVDLRRRHSGLEKEKDALNDRICVAMAAAGIRHSLVPGPSGNVDVKLEMKSRKKLDADLIPEAIAKAATIEKPYETLTVKERNR